MVGPSARGSLKGIPSSRMSAPDAARVLMSSKEVSASGYPAVR